MDEWRGVRAKSRSSQAPACERSGTTIRSACSPSRSVDSNGYKQYGVGHLVRLVRIKRLTDLGFSLTQIADMDDSDDHPEEALRSLDAELAATIDRLQRARAELGLILRHSAPTELPPEFVPPATVAKLSDADRSLVVVLTRVLGPQGLEVYANLLRTATDEPVATAFDNLPSDADDATRQDVAERLVPYIQKLYAAHPGLLESRADAPKGARFVDDTIAQAMSELYNEAQLDVLVRTRKIMRANETGD